MHRIFTLLFLFLYTATYCQTFELVKDINPDGNSLPRDFYSYKDNLYFTANDGTNGNELWVSDGTPDGTYLFKDVDPGSGSSNPDDYIIFNDLLYFEANNQLWVSDGTEAGTQLVFNVEMDENIVFDSLIYFSGTSDYLWSTDGTAANTIQVGTDEGPQNNFVVYDDKLFYSQGRYTYVVENGVISYYSSFDIRDIVIYKDTLFAFYLDEMRYFEKGSNIPKLVKKLNSYTEAINEVVATEHLIFFSGPADNLGDELWISDGTSNGTYVLKDILPGFGSSRPEKMTVVGDKVYFRAKTESNGEELFVSDGTEENTQLIDINPGPGSSNPTNLTAIGNELYFSADDGISGRELWRITAEGTLELFQDIEPGSDGSGPEFMTKVGTSLFFRASGDSGSELYKVDFNDLCLGIVCPPGQVCYGGVCYPDQTDSCSVTECPDGEVCYEGYCYPIATDSCSVTECPDGEVCYEGYCYPIATDSCSVIDCPDGEVCYEGYCYPIATDSCSVTECPDGEVCYEGYCYPVATDSCSVTECPDGEVCYEGYCYPVATDSCSVTECPDGEVCYEGYCYPVATDSCSVIDCPEGESCYDGVCLSDCSSSTGVNCIDLGPDIHSGDGATIILSANSGYDLYEWSNGDTTQTILVDASGQYWVIAYNFTDSTSSSDTINVLIECNPEGNCPEGTSCIDGFCFDDADPCAGITCAEGEVCFDGACFPSCAEELCDDGTYCFAGNCYEQATCENIVCATDVECVDGSCPSATSNIEFGKLSGIKFYPNPTNGIVNISYDGDPIEATVVIQNMLGQKLYSRELVINSSTTTLHDLSDYLRASAVFVTITYEDISIHEIIILDR